MLKALTKERKIFKLICLIVILLILCVPLRTVAYLACEFILCINRCNIPMESRPRKDIPKQIHQIFFNVSNSSKREKFEKGPESCKKHNPSYLYTLWNETMVDDLIEKEFPHIKDLYQGYDHWVKRLDVTKYIVLYHFGGWYIDMDIICKRSIDELSTKARRKDASVIVHTTGPVGISNDFIGISKMHPFLYDVIRSLRTSNKWYFVPYLSTMFSTGPTFFWGRYLNYPRQNDFYVMNNQSHYIDNLHWASWHSYDGIVIWYLFRKSPDLQTIFLVLILILTAIILLLRYWRRKQTHEKLENGI